MGVAMRCFHPVVVFVCTLFYESHAACHYIDSHWLVSYTGLKKYDLENESEPPIVFQVDKRKVNVSWAHIIQDAHCVDRYILHVWDVKKREMRYIYDSSTFDAIITVPACTGLKIKVELQEDDLPGRPADSRLTYPAHTALVTQWSSPPIYNMNRSTVQIDKSESHWSRFFDPDYLRGLEVDWSDSVENPGCIINGEIVVSRIIPGLISDTLRQIKVKIDYSDLKFTLALP